MSNIAQANFLSRSKLMVEFGEGLMSTAKTTKSGTVEKVIKPADPRDPEKAQINVHGAEPLYQEIRIENTLIDDNGIEVKLREGAEVELHVEADKNQTAPKVKN
jgi:hypothetical protein